MPRVPGWLSRLPDAIEQLRGLPRDTITRADLQVLLGVSKRRAVALMHEFGAQALGHALVLERETLIRQLTVLRRGRAFHREIDRRVHLVAALRRARADRVRVPVPKGTSAVQLDGLPDGVVITPGRIEVRFSDAREAVQRLYTLAQALLNDFDAFEERTKPPADQSTT